MSPETQIQEALCVAALSLPDAAHRQAFLDRACGTDAELRASVEGMLADYEKADRYFARGEAALKTPEVDAAIATSLQESGLAISFGADADEWVGRYVGRYKMLQKLGEGGCGVVYMAEQKEPMRRLVAVKVIKLGMDTKSVIARFESERQALAMMDHPNIAHVLDAGATETGRPYFVMELVRGERITKYCDESNLDTRQRLELFIQVCLAIQHAHQKGVIHRDIKPSNILVSLHDGVPVPKVIDFGIAKATEGRLTDHTEFTAYDQFVGTPAYMSPEQAELGGLDVDTRSDIYSLGVLLYELLTGRTPFDTTALVQSGLDEMRRTLREKDPVLPSTMITSLRRTELNTVAVQRHAEPLKLISTLKRDLDWIVMKALEKDRTRRYETANGLARDVERYLNNEMVVARPPSRRYRFQKLVLRNKLVFLAGSLVLLSLMAGLGTSTWLFIREREARHQQAVLREEAESAKQRAEEREKVIQAAILVTQGKFDEASRLLGEIKSPLTKPSLDAVAAYGDVGEWLALQGRWGESTDRYLSLLEIEKRTPLGKVTLHYQACGVALVESGEKDRYVRFCEASVESFATTPNGDAAGRILKSCLLIPPTRELLERMQPLGEAADGYFLNSPPGAPTAWRAIPVGLWYYRSGNYELAIERCQRGLNQEDKVSSQTAALRTILAMASQQLGRDDEARRQLAKARETVDAKFKAPLERGDANNGFWYDWIFARQLLSEASSLIDISDSAVPAFDSQQK